MNKVLIAPSILSANFARLEKQIAAAAAGGADWIHVDVMDGHFVPNITAGPVVVASIKKALSASKRLRRLPLDVHLMISDPEKYSGPFAKAGADLLTFHMEAIRNPAKLIRHIRKLGVKVGASIKPKTPAEKILPYLRDLDLVLVMTVEPGFGGQEFMEDMLPKICKISNEIAARRLRCRVEVDGGIDPDTAPLCVAAGADVFVAGNSVFGGPESSIASRVRLLRRSCC